MRGAGGGVGGAGTNMRSEARQAAAERAGCCLVLALLLLLPPAAGLPRLPRPAAAAEADQLMEWIRSDVRDARCDGSAAAPSIHVSGLLCGV
jgi:hypothetical protein